MGIGFSVRLHFLVWVVSLFRGWPGLSGVTLGIFLVHCVLCCAAHFDFAYWWELMDDETSSRYIFFVMLLLILFL